MRRKKVSVYVPEIDRVFESLGEASKTLHVDPGNISKVIRGKRKTAGGYNFISGITSKGRRKTLSSLRKEARALIPDELAEEREELRRAIQSVNKQAKRLAQGGLGTFSAAMTDLMAMGDIFGRTKAGYLRSSESVLVKLSRAEIRKYLQTIEQRKKRRSYTIGGALAEAEHLAGTFGTTSSRIVELSDSLPFIFALLHNSLPGEDISDVIRQKAEEVFNDPDASVNDMIKELGQLSEYFDTADALEELMGNDFFRLDRFDEIRPKLNALYEASQDPNSFDPQAAVDDLQDISKMIFEHWGDADATELLKVLNDDLDTALHRQGIWMDEEEEDD